MYHPVRLAVLDGMLNLNGFVFDGEEHPVTDSPSVLCCRGDGEDTHEHLVRGCETPRHRAYKGECHDGEFTRNFDNKSTKPTLEIERSDLLHYSLYPHEAPVEEVDEEDCLPRYEVVVVSCCHS